MSDPTNSIDPQVSPKRPVSWGRVALVISLALNLAVVGLIAGAAVRGGGPAQRGEERARTMQTRDFGFAPYIAAFSDDERRTVGRAFLKQAGKPAEARRAIQSSFEAVISALQADPFDADGFKALLLAQQKDLASRQSIGASVLADHLAGMAPADRAAYADKLDHILTRPPLREGGGKNGERHGPNGGAVPPKPPRE